MKILIREQGKKDGGVYHFMTAIKKTDTGKYFSKKIFVRFFLARILLSRK